MPSLLEQLRSKNPSVKRGIALGVAGVIALLILGAWFSATPQNGSSEKGVSEGPFDAFKGLFDFTKDKSKEISRPFQDLQNQFTDPENQGTTTPITQTAATSTSTTTSATTATSTPGKQESVTGQASTTPAE